MAWTPESERSGGNGDDEVPPFLRPFVRHLERQMTPEGKEARRRALEEALGQGDLMYESLGGFQLERTCPKCAYNEPADVHHISEGAMPIVTGRHDALARECKRCHFVWIERCLDADEQPPRTGLLPLHDLSYIIGSVYREVYGSEMPEGWIGPAELAKRIRKQLELAGHKLPPEPDASASAQDQTR